MFFACYLACALSCGLCAAITHAATPTEPPTPPAAADSETTPADNADPADSGAATASANGASDDARTQALLQHLEQGRLSPDHQRLDNNGKPLLIRYQAARGAQTYGAVVVIPEIPSVVSRHSSIDALLAELPPNGWGVLVLQPPLLSRRADVEDYAALLPEVAEQIKVALGFLHNEGLSKISLVSFEAGAEAARLLLGDSTINADIETFVTRGYWQGGLEGIELPVLELVGARDKRAIRASETRQRYAERELYEIYQQHKLNGIGRNYALMDDAVARYLRGWLVRTRQTP